jgi:hypothetical protein
MGDSSAAKITFLGIFCDFFGMWRNPDNFDHLTEVSVMVNGHGPDNFRGRNIFCVRTILVWADTDILVGFRGSSLHIRATERV